jgi:hypothetical protein
MNFASELPRLTASVWRRSQSDPLIWKAYLHRPDKWNLIAVSGNENCAVKLPVHCFAKYMDRQCNIGLFFLVTRTIPVHDPAMSCHSPERGFNHIYTTSLLGLNVIAVTLLFPLIPR